MAVDQVVDDYLHSLQQIVGTTPAPGAAPAYGPSAPLNFPTADWIGSAHDAAQSASDHLQQARHQLATASQNAATVTESAKHIADTATAELGSITTEWEHAKSAAAALPSPGPRDAALIPAAQTTIHEAIDLITTTTSQYAAAAENIRKHAGTLPNTPATPNSPGSPAEHHPNTPGTPAEANPADENLAAHLPTETSPAAAATAPTALDPGTLASAANAIPTAAGALPSMMSPAMGLPAGAAPLGGMLAPLMQSTAATAPTTDTTRPPGTPAHNPGSASTPRTVDEAIDGALDALNITDPEARQRWHDGYRTLIFRESSNVIHAIANGDSNATGPMMPDGGYQGSSRGLAQVTPSTFDAFWVPGTSRDIFDPVANIAASMNYVISDPKYLVSRSGIDLASKIAQANPNSAGGGY
ncbi:transglycosylase SLT domain-containing protein [Mycobacteroides abscessus subsp. abscessus]|uniref:hypothetical protein n=1 Tax=Mycobacteroides abscessus TaxID=36809 RepID=UPI000926685D|nr:hypothetical protein [Mycobacteroides abscessus]SIJ00794.1 transglycosylase SLT domain-containing protein [Mycobacteroides abscessus subsp. abscessus]SIN14272.1 transglycosylase SLT domain-containing protein [Mycobacteroides abscessus subsp. abscessus]